MESFDGGDELADSLANDLTGETDLGYFLRKRVTEATPEMLEEVERLIASL